ncbi:MAG: LacI family DNA-binding transcriptional regulator [Rhodothermales bacterium]
MVQRISIKDVAKEAGVSTATVSNVFSGKKPVNSDLVAKVKSVAEKLGFKINKAASLLRSGKTRVVAVLVPDLKDTFFSTIVSELETQAFEDGYDVIVASSHNSLDAEVSRLNALMGWEPAGLIVVPCSGTIPEELVQINKEFPLVLVDRIASENAIADTVTIDNFAAGEMAAQHVLELGHDDVLLVVSDLEFPPISERANGAETIIETRTGLSPKILQLGSDMSKGAETFSRWLDKNGAPGAVIALNNVTSLSVLSAFAEKGIDIPGTTSFVAFDDYAWMSARNTGLTAVRQPADEIASAVWQRLKLRMEDNSGVEITPTILSAELIERASVRTIDKESKEFGTRIAQ